MVFEVDSKNTDTHSGSQKNEGIYFRVKVSQRLKKLLSGKLNSSKNINRKLDVRVIDRNWKNTIGNTGIRKDAQAKT